jgi:very-short-patch-repair endonuclease
MSKAGPGQFLNVFAADSLRGAGVTGFVQNVELVVAGRRLFPDFYWPDLRAILEIDSREHHFEEADWQATLRRDQILQSAAYLVLHVTPRQVYDTEQFIRTTTGWLAAARLRSL